MGRFLTRGLWLVAVLGAVVLIAWHVMSPAAVTAQAPVPTVTPTLAADPFAGTEAPLPDGEALTQAVEKAAAGQPGTYRVAVEDVATGELLVDRDAGSVATPASSLKLLTGAAALATFKHDHRFETASTLDVQGRLRLVGGGDALLGAGDSQAGSVAGHAGLKTLARDAVASLKEKNVTGERKVYVDTSLFPGAGLNPAWTEDLVTTNNITDVQTPALNAGRSAPSPTAAVVRQPADAALAAFVDQLNAEAKAQGLRATFAAAGGIERDKEADPLASVSSATLLEQLQYMESHSDNFMAESFGRLVATARGLDGSYEGARTAVADAVRELGVDTEGLEMIDTSGLAASNKVSPATLAGLLTHAATSERADLRELATLLPVAGRTGTLAGRLSGTETQGLVRAKTGTLAAIVSLSGYVTTADGRALSFSVMASNVKGALLPARGVADAIAADLATYRSDS